MLLCEAIRLGSMMKPQGFGVMHDPITNHTCALGAAADAIGKLDDFEFGSMTAGGWARMWPICEQHVFVCVPVKVNGVVRELRAQGGVQSIIIYLNDKFKWTREEIADWLETVEKPQTRAEAIETPQTVGCA